MTWRDLTALPCSHPHCCSVGYLLRDDSGSWKSLAALIGHDRLKQWLDLEPDLLANRIADDAIPARCARSSRTRCSTCSREQSSLSHPSMASIWTDICTNCDLGIGTLRDARRASTLPGQHERLRRLLGERVLRVTVKPFMDMNTMIEERLTQCCVHVATVNGERAPTSARRSAPCRPGRRSSRSRISTAAGPAAVREPMSDPRQVSAAAAATVGAAAPYDPLRLCVFATVALLGWLLGPVALLGFSVLGVVGYARARRAGLLRSKCKLGDTRLVMLLPRPAGGRGRCRHLPVPLT